MTNRCKQNALLFYVRVLLYVVLALVVRAAALAPLCCLFLCEGGLRWLAVLCPVIWALVVVPLRYSFAQAMTQEPRSFSFDKAFSFANYGEKLAEGLLHALHVLKWGVPFMAMLGLCAYWYTQVEYLEMYQTVDAIGNACAQGLGAVAGWLAGLTGGESVVVMENNFMLGVGAVLAVVFGLGGLVWAWGVVRNSASRYIWAIAARSDRAPHAEMRRRLRGRRLRQLGVGLINLVLWLPFLYVAGCALKSAMSDASTLLMMAIATGELPTQQLLGAAAPVAAAFAGLYLPLLPLRRWNTAAFAMRSRRVKAQKKAAA